MQMAYYLTLTAHIQVVRTYMASHGLRGESDGYMHTRMSGNVNFS